MSKYTVTRKCGHQEVINIGGKCSERDRKAEWEERRLCYDCWKAEQQAKREAENKAAAEAAKENNLPELSGSEKQIAWAETIRSAMFNSAQEIEIKSKELLARIESGDIPSGKTEEQISRAKAELEGNLSAVQKLKNTISAKWFIDNKDSSINQIIIDLRAK